MTREDRKLAIVRAALPLFASKGFAETTTKDLARAAGISEPLLYKHFPSKEALYEEIQNFSCRGTDPVVQKLRDMKASTETLVCLMYYVMRALVLGEPETSPPWPTRHRLMINSFLHDGQFARMIYRTRFDGFCARMEECLEVAASVGDVVRMPVARGNRVRFAHHVGAWIALVHLPRRPAIDYRETGRNLVNQAMWFVLRGIGLTDKAIQRYYKPERLGRFFRHLEKRPSGAEN